MTKATKGEDEGNPAEEEGQAGPHPGLNCNPANGVRKEFAANGNRAVLPHESVFDDG